MIMKKVEDVGSHLALTLLLNRLQRLHMTLYFNWAPTWPRSTCWKCQELTKQDKVKKKKKNGPRLWQQKCEFKVCGLLKNWSSCVQVIRVGSCVCDAVELWQPKRISLSNMKVSIFFPSLNLNTQLDHSDGHKEEVVISAAFMTSPTEFAR